MKWIVVVAAAAAALSVVNGCSSTLPKAQAQAIVMTYPDRYKGYAIHCDGPDNDMGECRKLAQKLCADSYKIMGQNGALAHAEPGHDRRLLVIECIEKCPIASSEYRCK